MKFLLFLVPRLKMLFPKSLSQRLNSPVSWQGKGIHTFSKDINPKVNEIGILEFEFAYYDIIVLHVNYYIMGTQCFCWVKVRFLYANRLRVFTNGPGDQG